MGQILLGRYRIVDTLGSGGMGTVYEAEMLSTHRRVAVKILQSGLGKIELIRRRFEREALAVARLEHPHIVDVSDYGVLPDGGVFLVMDLVRGTPLGDLLDRNALSASRRLAVARQVLSAIVHAHAAGVVHRDLKPDNVMVISNKGGDHAMLLDFGIAKLLADGDEAPPELLTQAGVAFGTPEYMSPEQARGEIVDERADQYAFGIMLFELVTGHRPFDAEDKVALLHLQMNQPPPTLAQAGGAFLATQRMEALVARALAKKREDRFPDAAALMAALEAASAELSHQALGRRRAEAMDRVVRRRRLRMLAALAGLAVLFAFATWLRYGKTRPLGASLAPLGKSLGQVRMAGGNEGHALDDYTAALHHDPGLQKDKVIRRDVSRLASSGRDPGVRARARELASRIDATAQVDLFSSFAMDLAQSRTCSARQRAIAPLRALKDKRAIIVLEHARSRGSTNSCLERDAREAIDFLEALP
jgi:serine/threonine protein kinase